MTQDIHKTREELLEEIAQLGQQMESRLREYERRYYRLLEQSTDAVFILDLNGINLEVNRRAADMLGHFREEITGVAFRQMVAPAKLQKTEAMFHRLLAGETLPVYESTLCKKDGAEFPVEINMEAVRDDSGQLLYIQALVRDISERKQSDITLHESESRFRTIVETARDAIYIKDQNRVYTHVNPAVEMQHGQPAAALIGKTDLELFGAEADAQIKPVDLRVLAGEVIEQEQSRMWNGVLHTFVPAQHAAPRTGLLPVRFLRYSSTVGKRLSSDGSMASPHFTYWLKSASSSS